MSGFSADAQPWEWLPDGRVVIEIKGRRLALPSEGEELKDFQFVPETLAPKIAFPEVIRDPDRARRFFAGAESVSVWLPNLPERSGPFLGRFERQREGFVPRDVGISIGAKVQGNCRGWARDFDRYRQTMMAEGRTADENGWAEFVIDKSPGSWVYVKGEPDPDLPRHFSSISCSYFGSCSASICIGEDMSVGYSWMVLRTRSRDGVDCAPVPGLVGSGR